MLLGGDHTVLLGGDHTVLLGGNHTVLLGGNHTAGGRAGGRAAWAPGWGSGPGSHSLGGRGAGVKPKNIDFPLFFQWLEPETLIFHRFFKG